MVAKGIISSFCCFALFAFIAKSVDATVSVLSLFPLLKNVLIALKVRCPLLKSEPDGLIEA